MLAAGTYWHPLNLPHYVAVRDLSDFTEAMIGLPVIEATPTDVDSVYVLSAVWAPTYADMMAGDSQLLTNVAFSGAGVWHGGWQTIEEDARQEVFVAMVLQVQQAADDLVLGQAELRVSAAGDVGENTPDPDGPGRLAEEGGAYFADYAVDTGNFGYSDAVAEAHIDAVLQSPLGWQRAGITFRNVGLGGGPRVIYRFVDGPLSCGGVTANGCTTPVGADAEVWVNYNRAIAGYEPNLINHESGHAFFKMGHSGGGIMNGLSPDGWPTDADIASVVAWLGP